MRDMAVLFTGMAIAPIVMAFMVWTGMLPKELSATHHVKVAVMNISMAIFVYAIHLARTR